MLKEKVLHKALGGVDYPLADPSRCIRMRYQKSACQVCLEQCKAGAVSLDGGVFVDEAKCTSCMLCMSECPAGCFSASEDDFPGLLSRLSALQDSVACPVLGCKKSGSEKAHEKTHCLGSLADEHLLALSLLLDKQIQLNLIDCPECENFGITVTVKERVERVRQSTGLKKIVIAEKKNALLFEDISYDRRSFFKLFKTMTYKQVSGLLDEKETIKDRSYSAKKISRKRDVLNKALKKTGTPGIINGLLEKYGFTVRTSSECTNCFSCVGMCPTGALKIRKDAEGPGLLFNSSMCTGCGLCGDFCHAAAMKVSPGFSGNNFFEHVICNADAVDF